MRMAIHMFVYCLSISTHSNVHICTYVHTYICTHFLPFSLLHYFINPLFVDNSFQLLSIFCSYSFLFLFFYLTFIIKHWHFHLFFLHLSFPFSIFHFVISYSNHNSVFQHPTTWSSNFCYNLQHARRLAHSRTYNSFHQCLQYHYITTHISNNRPA